MSGLTSLSWAPNTSPLHDIQTTYPCQSNPFHNKAILSLSWGEKLKNWGGMWPDVFSRLSPPSLKTSIIPGRLAYACFLCLLGLGA